MTQALILWVHALAALLFMLLAADRWRVDRLLAGALALTALWALAVAGLGARDLAAALAEAARDLAWLGLTVALVRRGSPKRFGASRAAASTLAAGLPLGLVAAALAEAVEPRAFAMVPSAMRLLIALAGLILLQAGARTRAPDQVAAALAMFWGVDLFAVAPAFLTGWTPGLVLARGVAVLGAGAGFALAALPGSGRRFGMSRDLGLGAIAGGALALYMALVVAATGLAASLGGANARMIQTAIVVGAAAALLTLISTPWLRAWTRVVIEKHLWGERYDYRTAWARFTDRLGRPGEDGPLPRRVVQAVADLFDAPAGLLLLGDQLERAADWRWAEPAGGGGAELARHLRATGRIIDLDAVRAGAAPPEEADAVPGWMRGDRDAWALAPLIHHGALVGAILLARPPVSRPIDWEDLDLLRLAGRQAASYLQEDRAHAALADAERFDEFNRRFAFILHDIKNLVSQVSLVARNAERHGADPEFRADMIATLNDAAARMATLVERLSHRSAGGAPAVAVDISETLEAIARGRRAQHPVLVQAEAGLFALADPAGLERMLGHLVQNAVEASPPAAPVTVSARARGGRVLIEVADQGTGMDAAFVRDRLFRPFASSKPGGFGLGAFEARELARAMGGAIEVDSREGEGTRFTVSLPAVRVLERAA